ncbi:MAG TPA: hypothetical protein VNS81_04825 [Nocardioides sp.]|nr:hypothetical protein [Nocardioides sp.]
MPDPIDDLFRSARQGGGLEGGDMPLSAAEVRRRGDRIRRRRNALVAGGAALAVAAVAVPALALFGGQPKSDSDRVAPKPEPKAVSAANLITDDDTVYVPGAADWFTTDTSPGDGQSVFHPCAREALAGLGATSVFRRDFELRNLEAGAPDVKGDYLGEAVAQFRSEEDARAAYDTVARWVLDCDGHIPEATTYTVVPKAHSVDVPDGDAVIYDAHWGPVPKEIDPYGDSAYIGETGIALVGDRISVLTSVVVGQDYDFVGKTPVEQMLPKAAARLATDGPAGAPAS